MGREFIKTHCRFLSLEVTGQKAKNKRMLELKENLETVCSINIFSLLFLLPFHRGKVEAQEDEFALQQVVTGESKTPSFLNCSNMSPPQTDFRLVSVKAFSEALLCFP